MIRTTLLLTFLLFANLVRAQEFDLARCLEYARTNSFTIQNSRLDEQIADARVRETAGLGLPQISGSVGFNHNIKLRRFFATYSSNSFLFGG